MGGGFGIFDIILFAMLAAFLVYRLRSVLGKRTGHEQRRSDPFASPDKAAETGNDNVISLPDRTPEEAAADVAPDSPLSAGITQIKIADPSFEVGSFLTGAQSAFEMVVNAYATGDGKTLNMLLSPEVYENFAGAIRSRELANHTQESTLVGIDSTDLLEAEMQDRIAVVTVKFVSEQINATIDENGDVVEGDRNAVVKVTDIWTFARDTGSSNPNWKLTATRSPS
ncbi:MAG: Tim44/TimA family putative adaptor protein [Alphaproteobacteria bacterium]|nr:Tim44/TimA family putative adaptor protein [Alphaproteobacteria bacterium]